MEVLSKQVLSESSATALDALIEKLQDIAANEFDSVAGYPHDVTFDIADVAFLAEVRDEIAHMVSQALNRTLEERLVLYKARYENLLPEKLMKSVSGCRRGNVRKRSLFNFGR